MKNTHEIFLISDSTGETIDRIFTALKAQFKDFSYKTQQFSFTRTENQISEILKEAKTKKNTIILYTLVDQKLALFLNELSEKNSIPCFGVLGELIENFSKILNKQSLNIPSRQHKLNEEYYERVEAIQFTMRHDDGNDVKDIEESDIILLGVSRTSKTPTSIYLANRGYKTSNIPLVNENSIPEKIKKNKKKICVVGLTTDPERLIDLRKNRLRSLKENEKTDYTNLKKISEEVKTARKTFKKYKWPVIDVTRKSVEETAASIIKIHEINSRNE
ncbi:kinase/pyrophosphorylase [Candidatus Pelagibacter sp.]|nr:kinase/pyrophosphorylase [Candidatus Pelagibacter sp.]